MRVRRATGQNRGQVIARQTGDIIDAAFLPFHTRGVTVIEGLLSLSAAAGFLAAACWCRLPGASMLSERWTSVPIEDRLVGRHL